MISRVRWLVAWQLYLRGLVNSMMESAAFSVARQYGCARIVGGRRQPARGSRHSLGLSGFLRSSCSYSEFRNVDFGVRSLLPRHPRSKRGIRC